MKIPTVAQLRCWSPLVMGIALCGACAMGCEPSTTGSSPDKKTQAVAEPEDPKVLYTRSCQSCHGPTGKGNGPRSRGLRNIPDFTAETWQQSHSDAQLLHTISEGQGSMPAFKHRYDEAQIKALIEVVRGLKGSSG
ncbi:MAG: c-type cytochrome [Myxococcota bacterium]